VHEAHERFARRRGAGAQEDRVVSFETNASPRRVSSAIAIARPMRPAAGSMLESMKVSARMIEGWNTEPIAGDIRARALYKLQQPPRSHRHYPGADTGSGRLR
jgi:hypothetical protein